MNWHILAASLPILPGDIVWGPSSEGLTRRVTNGSRGEYLALDDNDMLARFDARLGERLGVGGFAQVVKTAAGWSVIGEKVVTLAHATPDPLVARVLLWEGAAPVKEAHVEVAPEANVAPETNVAPEAKEPAPLVEKPAPAKSAKK